MRYFLQLSLFLCLLTGPLHATVIQLTAPNDLSSVVNTLNDGDIIELISTSYEYNWKQQINIAVDKNITIRAKSGLASRPVVRFSNTAASVFIRLNSTLATPSVKKWKFEGICFDGYNSGSNVYATGFFVSNVASQAYGINFEADNCLFRNFSDITFIYQGNNAPSSPTLAQGGNVVLQNCEFRSQGRRVLNSSSSLSYSPDSVSIRNCLFEGPVTESFILLTRANFKHYDINHCSFINSASRELNLAQTTQTSYIRNCLFLNNTNTNSNTYSVTLGADCGIYYTGSGTRSTIYPRSTSARTTNPAPDAQGIATASTYLTGSTDGLPVGFYGNQITLSERELNELNYPYGAGPSASKTLIVSGVRLTNPINVQAPAGFEISTTASTAYSSSLTLNPSSKTVSPTTIYVRLAAGKSAGTYSGNIRFTSTGSASKTAALSGTVAEGAGVFPSVTSLSGFSYTFGSGPSAQQQFVLNASSLTANAIVTAPTGYELSLTSGVSFAGSATLNIAAIAGKITNLNIYVRLKSLLSAGTYNGNINITSTGAGSKTIALSGTVNAAPVIINTNKTSLSNFSYNYGNGPSAIQNLTVNGTGITDNITLTAPASYEISTTGGTAFSAKSSILLSPVAGNVATTTIYVRLKKDLAIGIYNESLSVSATGGTSKQINLSGFVSEATGITSSVSSLTGFNYDVQNGPSAEKAFIITGNNLTSYVIVTAPANYEVSTGSGASFSGAGQMLLDPNAINGQQLTIYCRLMSGLSVGAYSGSLTISSSGVSSKTISLSGNVYNPITIKTDPASYAPRMEGKLTLTSKWLFSKNLANYSAGNELVAASGIARDVTTLNAKLLFTDRANKQIVVINGTTGLKETPIPLNSSLFTYTGRNKANTADSTYLAGSYQFYGIKTDNAGNLLISNLISTGTDRFQIYKIDTSTGNGTLVIDQPNLSTLFPSVTSIRLDFFSVWGDVNNNAVILAANSGAPAMVVFKWTITNGTASAPVAIPLDNITTGTSLTGLENLGGYARTYQTSDTRFYVDGGSIYPTLVNNSGQAVSGFYKQPTALIDSITISGQKWAMNTGNNGVAEFSLGDNHFLITSATNAAGSPASTFRLFKFKDNNKAFEQLECLWTFPQAGFGATSNSYRTAVPMIETNGNTAYIYLYCGENGVGKYEMVYDPNYTDVQNHFVQSPAFRMEKNEIVFEKQVDKIDVFTLTGLNIVTKNAVTRITKPSNPGIYILQFTSEGKLTKAKILVD